MTAKGYLFLIVAAILTGIFSVMSVHGAYGVYTAPDQWMSRYMLTAGAILADVLAILSMLTMIEAHREGNLADTIMWGLAWVVLSAGSVWAAGSFLKHESFITGAVVTAQQIIVEADKTQLVNAQADARSPDKKV